MRALAFASFLSGIVWTVLINDGLAQPTATPVKPQVYSISGNTVILPRQAGSKDAPDVTFSVPRARGQNDRPQGGRSDAVTPADVPGNRRPR